MMFGGCKTSPKNEGKELNYKDLDEKLPEYKPEITPMPEHDASVDAYDINKKEQEREE